MNVSFSSYLSYQSNNLIQHYCSFLSLAEDLVIDEVEIIYVQYNIFKGAVYFKYYAEVTTLLYQNCLCSALRDFKEKVQTNFFSTKTDFDPKRTVLDPITKPNKYGI